MLFIEYEIIGEGSRISTNQKRESTASWLLIGRNLRPFPDNFVPHCLYQAREVKLENLTFNRCRLSLEVKYIDLLCEYI